MISKIVDRIVMNQIKNNQISYEDINIYKYGYIILMEVLTNIIIALVIGLAFKKLSMIIIFLVFFIPLRSFCGGWHADKFWKCTIFSNVILVVEIIMFQYIEPYLSGYVLLILFIVCMVIVIKIAPIETPQKIIYENERKIYKRKIKIICGIHTITMIVMFAIMKIEIMFTLTYVYFVQVVLLFFEKKKCSRKHILQ